MCWKMSLLYICVKFLENKYKYQNEMVINEKPVCFKHGVMYR